MQITLLELCLINASTLHDVFSYNRKYVTISQSTLKRSNFMQRSVCTRKYYTYFYTIT